MGEPIPRPPPQPAVHPHPPPGWPCRRPGAPRGPGRSGREGARGVGECGTVSRRRLREASRREGVAGGVDPRPRQARPGAGRGVCGASPLRPSAASAIPPGGPDCTLRLQAKPTAPASVGPCDRSDSVPQRFHPPACVNRPGRFTPRRPGRARGPGRCLPATPASGGSAAAVLRRAMGPGQCPTTVVRLAREARLPPSDGWPSSTA